MVDILYDQERENRIMLKEAREEAMAEGEARGKIEATIKAFYSLVKEGILDMPGAAKRANMTEDDFAKAVRDLAIV